MKILYSQGSVLLTIIATYLILYRFHRLKILDFDSMVIVSNPTFITSCDSCLWCNSKQELSVQCFAHEAKSENDFRQLSYMMHL